MGGLHNFRLCSTAQKYVLVCLIEVVIVRKARWKLLDWCDNVQDSELSGSLRKILHEGEDEEQNIDQAEMQEAEQP